MPDNAIAFNTVMRVDTVDPKLFNLFARTIGGDYGFDEADDNDPTTVKFHLDAINAWVVDLEKPLPESHETYPVYQLAKQARKGGAQWIELHFTGQEEELWQDE